MGEFRYIPPDEVAERHRAARSPKASPRQANNGVTTKTIERQPVQRNVEQVLSLGAVRYITFGPRTYRLPPVPFRLGQRVLDLHVKIMADAKQVAMTGDRAAMKAFYQKHDQMAKLLWKHIRPLGVMKRMLWHLGLMTNPFRRASEGELKAIVDFFLQGRMTSSVRSISEAEAQTS